MQHARAHFEAELVVVLVEGDVHQAATKTVVWKNEENVLQNLVNMSKILNTQHRRLATSRKQIPESSQRLKPCIALHRKPISELRGITCHMRSHSVTCHSTQVNAPHLNPSQTGQYSIYLLRRDGRLS